ncbi:MAG: peptide deformylase [Myxococcaceae bacterium]
MNRFVLLFALATTACATVPKAPPVQTEIVQTGAPVLRSRAREVPAERILTPEFQSLIAKMISTMRAAPGVGLAAPQIGEPSRAFVIEDAESFMSSLSEAERAERERIPVPLRVFINPVVTPLGEKKVTFFEGCLSVTGFGALVPRFHEIEVSALDEKGQPVSWRTRGWPARILQHEMDHLDGTLYVDRMHTRSFGTLSQIKERFAGKPIAEVLKSLE